MQGRNGVSHGTRNFLHPRNIGEPGNLSLPDFIAQMEQAQSSYKNCIAVHTLIPPLKLLRGLRGKDIQAFGYARRSQHNQILSCFYWLLGNFLNERASTNAMVARGLQTEMATLRKYDLPPTYMSFLLLAACRLVLEFNLDLAHCKFPMIFMEDFLDAPEVTAQKLGLQDCDNQPINVPVENAHSSRVKDLPFVDGMNERLDALLLSFRVAKEDRSFSAAEIEKMLFELAV